MSEAQRVEAAATAIAEAIGRRDVEGLDRLLLPGFMSRRPGEEGLSAAAFLDGVKGIPGEIAFVRLLSFTVDIVGDSAVATGVQHARVRIDGKDIDDQRPFVDWFVKFEGEWRLRLAVELPPAS